MLVGHGLGPEAGNGKLNSQGHGRQISHGRGKQKSHGHGQWNSHSSTIVLSLVREGIVLWDRPKDEAGIQGLLETK